MTTVENQKPERPMRTIKGVVVSDKMTKTRIIVVKRTLKHRLYHKGLVRATRLFVHDEKEESKVGDVIMAVSTRPLSKNKNFRLLKVLEKKVSE